MIHLVYRGPLERSRLGFLAEGVAAALGPVKLWWLTPGSVDRRLLEHAARFLKTQPAFDDYEILDGAYAAIASARRRLSPVLAARAPLVVVGEDAIDFVRGARTFSLIWCVNGVPEERKLVPTWRQRLAVRAEWSLRRVGRRPDLIVTVSEPMSEHYRVHAGVTATLAVPCCVDRAVFRAERPAADREPVVSYLGSGAKWQALTDIAAIWARAAALRGDLRFLVVSRDQRCDRLLAGLGRRGRRVGADEPTEVAATLQQARVGMLVRRPHLVNEVAFPTKFGEYVACGLSVFATDLGWDVSQVVRETGCGTLVDPDQPLDRSAALLIDLVDASSEGRRRTTAAAADLLARDRWVEILCDAVNNVVS